GVTWGALWTVPTKVANIEIRKAYRILNRGRQNEPGKKNYQKGQDGHEASRKRAADPRRQRHSGRRIAAPLLAPGLCFRRTHRREPAQACAHPRREPRGLPHAA